MRDKGGKERRYGISGRMDEWAGAIVVSSSSESSPTTSSVEPFLDY